MHATFFTSSCVSLRLLSVSAQRSLHAQISPALRDPWARPLKIRSAESCSQIPARHIQLARPDTAGTRGAAITKRRRCSRTISFTAQANFQRRSRTGDNNRLDPRKAFAPERNRHRGPKLPAEALPYDHF